jgi:hypothetical protein
MFERKLTQGWTKTPLYCNTTDVAQTRHPKTQTSIYKRWTPRRCRRKLANPSSPSKYANTIKYDIVVLYESCPASWSFMKIYSVTLHFTLHKAKNDFLTHTFHISSLISVKFDNMRCSHNFLEHFWISWKSVRKKSCFTCRRKWHFASIFYTIQPTW